MSANIANPTSPYRSYATPPTSPSPSNLNSLTNPTSAPAASAPAPGRSRRTPYNPSRPVPTLRREESCYGEESDMGAMILNIAGIDRIGYVQLGGVPVNEELTESQLGQVGLRSGWMVAVVGEDNGSQFTQGSDTSQLFDSQASQSLIPGIHTLNPYQLPSAPTVRERQPSSSTSPSRPRGRHGLRGAAGSSLLSGTSVRRAVGRQSTGTVLSGMLEDGEEYSV